MLDIKTQEQLHNIIKLCERHFDVKGYSLVYGYWKFEFTPFSTLKITDLVTDELVLSWDGATLRSYANLEDVILLLQGKYLAGALFEKVRLVSIFVNSKLKTTPDADFEVLKFIADFRYHGEPGSNLRSVSQTLSYTFSETYSLYFACMLQVMFNRGAVLGTDKCYWLDVNGVKYAINGSYI